MKPLLRLATLVFSSFVITAPAAQASHISFLGTVDAIDHTFAAGGGTYAGSLSSVIDDGWVVFAANAGDVLSFTFQTIATNFMDGVVLLANGDGVVNVGDVAGILNFNSSVAGQGINLVAQHGPLISGVCAGFYCFDTVGGSFSFVAAQTGQYVIGLTSSNESQATQFRVTVRGNTRDVGPVPEPSTMAVFGVGLAALAARRRRRS